MSYTFEKVSSNKVKLSFAVDAEQFEAAVQKAYLKARNQIRVDGFRKGKAPRFVIERIYGSDVFYQDALDFVFPDEYEAAIEGESLKVVDRPELVDFNVAEDKSATFVVEVFVRPEVTLGEYKNLTVEVEKETVTDADIDARIEADRKKAARTIDVEDRAVENGDTVNLDYAGYVDGVAFAGGTAQGQTLTIGSNQFIPGFEEQMVGMAIGEEKDLDVTFPEAYHAEELAGKAAVFHVKVNSITKTELPELDDEFAADISDFDTFAAYKESIVKELTDRAEKNNDVTVENALIMKAVENATMDIPAAMIEDQLNYVVREMEMRMMYQGLRMEDYLKYTGSTMEQFRNMYRGEAQRRVEVELVLEAIRAAEGVEPTEEEVAAQIAKQAESMGKEVAEFEATLTEEQRSYLTDTAAVQKVVDLLKQGATVTEKAAEEAKEEE